MLTGSDVQKLVADPSAENRAEAAVKVAQVFSSGQLAPKERKIVEDIFRAMVRDTEELVRRSLSESLKTDPSVPHDVAAALARDLATVSLPMIEFSDVLSDQDLIEIVKARPASHQMAVARRAQVSSEVSEALADAGNEDVVATLVANPGALIGEATYGKVLDRFGTSEKVNAPLALRGNLSIRVVERLVSVVSESLREQLISRHGTSVDALTDLVLQVRERTIVSMLAGGAKSKDVVDLVDELYEHKRLTPTIVMRALCMGDVTFFEAALARMANVPIRNTYRLVHDEGDLGLRALFQKCGLSLKMLSVARVAIKTAGELELQGNGDRLHFRQLMIERLLTQFEDDFSSENLDYFITKLDHEARGHQAA